MIKELFNNKRVKTCLHIVLIINIFAFMGVLLYSINEFINHSLNYGDVIVSVQTLVTIAALIVAIIAILTPEKEPMFKCFFIDQHGMVIDDRDLSLGINNKNEIGYLPCSPSNWELYIVNIGESIAENVNIEISLDKVMFNDMSWLYDVKDFQYGLGVFGKLVLETGVILRQGETFRLPKIPFQYAETGADDGDIVKLNIDILCNNKSIFTKVYDIKVERDDMVSSEIIDEIIYDESVISELYTFVENQGKDTPKSLYAYLNPYNCIIDKNKKEIYRKIYYAYLKHDLFEYSSDPSTRITVKKKMNQGLNVKRLFWGRIYYMCEGIPVNDIELRIRNDIDYGVY